MAKPARSLLTLPELRGWITFGEAAAEMGISVERVRQLATNPGGLETACRIGRRPLGIVREVEVRQWIEDRQAAAEARERARKAKADKTGKRTAAEEAGESD
jgi:hypothetical protein